MLHHLKIWPEYFAAVVAGTKLWELRANDRDYRPGDTLLLQEYDPVHHAYTGQHCRRKVLHVATNLQGLQPGYALLSLQQPKDSHDQS